MTSLMGGTGTHARRESTQEGKEGRSGRTHMCDSEQWRSTKAVGGKCEGGVGTDGLLLRGSAITPNVKSERQSRAPGGEGGMI